MMAKMKKIATGFAATLTVAKFFATDGIGRVADMTLQVMNSHQHLLVLAVILSLLSTVTVAAIFLRHLRKEEKAETAYVERRKRYYSAKKQNGQKTKSSKKPAAKKTAAKKPAKKAAEKKTAKSSKMTKREAQLQAYATVKNGCKTRISHEEFMRRYNAELKKLGF